MRRLRPRDTVVQALVGRTNGERDFFLVERLHGFSTTIERHAQKPESLGVGYRELRLPVVTLATLCEAQGLVKATFSRSTWRARSRRVRRRRLQSASVPR